jgi:hypothetical protein
MKNEDTDKGDSGPSLSNEDYIRELEDFHLDFKQLEARVDRLVLARLKELAGGHLDAMLRNQEKTIEYLANENPKLRQAAVQIAYRIWNITNRLAGVYEKLAINDPDSSVRETAIGALGTCYRKTKDSRVGHLLASIARNEHLTASIRLTAFCSLLRLHGNMDYHGKSPLVPQTLEDIDWDFVNSYMCRSESLGPIRPA